MKRSVVLLLGLIGASAFPLSSFGETAKQSALAAKPAVSVASAKAFTNLPAGLSESAVRAHTIAPAHVQSVKIEEVDESKEVRFKLSAAARIFKTTPHLDTGAFGLAIHTALKDNVTGYMLQVRQRGKLIHTGVWNWSQTPADKRQGWNENARMHIASVSKFLTAVGLVKTLGAKNLSYDGRIIDYLPAHWVKGPKIDQITFRHLLTQTSGFKTDGSDSDYSFMKGMVKSGVATVGAYDYENMNFGIMRILIPIIRGDVSKSATFMSQNAMLNDNAWDAVTLYHFQNYMQNAVFTPAGVANVGFDTDGEGALAYPFPNKDQRGWNSGNLSSVAGGAGFRLSTKELLNVLDHVRRKGTIIPADKAQYMLDNYFGIDQVIDTPAGKIANKNGSWGAAGKTEQCVAYFLPNDMEVALFVNSPIGAKAYSLRRIVQDAFVASLEG